MVPHKEDILKILEAIRANSSYDLSNYSFNSIGRRFGKILMDFKITPDELISRIDSEETFIEEIIKKVTVNTTELFRDPAIWVNFRNNVLPSYMNYPEIKIWHPGCSTGQEVYSMMILLDDMGLLDRSKIYASDINSDVIETAKKGEFKLRFHQEFVKNFDRTLNPENREPRLRHEKYFTLDKLKDRIQMKKFLIDKPEYKLIDLVSDTTLFDERFDIIICRNVIIYFNYELQNRVLNLFYKNMSENSCLLLGLHESIIGPFASRFLKTEGVYFKR